MKKTLILGLTAASLMGLGTGVWAAGPTFATSTVGVQINVAKFADLTLADGNPLVIDLQTPSGSDSDSKNFTVRTNCDVDITVVFNRGLIDQAISYDLNVKDAGNATKASIANTDPNNVKTFGQPRKTMSQYNLNLSANWPNSNWWLLGNGTYQGSVQLTVSAVN